METSAASCDVCLSRAKMTSDSHSQSFQRSPRGLPVAAAATGKPRGLRWKDCEWESEVIFARDKQTSQLAALVSITIQFEAIPGSDMEGLPAVDNLRNASAVFF